MIYGHCLHLQPMDTFFALQILGQFHNSICTLQENLRLMPQLIYQLKASQNYSAKHCGDRIEVFMKLICIISVKMWIFR